MTSSVMRRVPLWTTLLAAVMAGALLVGCGSDEGDSEGGAAEEQSSDLGKLTAAIGATADNSDVIVAVNKGFFAKHGIDAELKSFPDGNDALDLVATGDADVGISTEPGGLVRRSKGANIYVAGMGATSADANKLVGQGSIREPKDLIGKAVGFPAGSGAHYFFRNYVTHYGLDADKIKQVNGAPPELLAALNRDDIQAMFIWDPWTETAVKEVEGVEVLQPSGKDGVYFATQYYYFSQRLVDEPELGQAAVQALVEANAWVAANRDEAAKVVAEELRLDEKQVHALLGHWKWGEVRFTPETEEKILGAAEVLKSAEVIEETPDMSTYLHPELLREVDAASVTIEAE